MYFMGASFLGCPARVAGSWAQRSAITDFDRPDEILAAPILASTAHLIDLGDAFAALGVPFVAYTRQTADQGEVGGAGSGRG
jgi:hypothetical protein